MSNTLEHFWTEQKIFSVCFGCPSLNSRWSVNFIMGSIQLNAVVMMNVFIQKVFFLCFGRINFSKPFHSSPLGATHVYFWFLHWLAFQYFFIKSWIWW